MRRLIKTVRLTPEQSGLSGCWCLIAVERVTIDLTKPRDQRQPETEIAYYASSHTDDERSDQQLLKLIVGHWDAIENGVHRVRDVTLGEDACRVARPKAARKRGRTKAPSLPSWQRSMTPSAALKRVRN